MAWVNVISPQTGNSDNGEWVSYTCRMLIPTAAISNAGLAKVRVAFFAASAEALYISKAYIGQAADAGDAYDFQSSPSQLLFATNAYKLVAANTYEYTDSLTFSIPAGKNLVISCYINGTDVQDSARMQSSMSGFAYYYKSGDDAATQNASGYSTGGTANALLAALRIEAEASGVFIPVLMDQYRQRKS
jgi:hypothetical protein